MTALETYIHKNHTIEIYPDFNPENPREWCNLGTLAIMGGLGDELPDRDNQPSPRDHIILPVYRYEHSGVAYATTPFHCPWDSAQTGYIYVSKEKVREEYNTTRIGPKTRAKAEAVLKAEVKTFSQWANGEVYGYIVKDQEEEIDSCWGFYGHDYVKEAAEETLQ